MSSIRVKRIGAPFELWDADHDTGIQVEETTDDDTIRFDIAGTEVFNATSTSWVINEAGNDVNFRIETDNEQNTFYIDGGNDAVGLLTATTAYQINGSSVTPTLSMRRKDSAVAINQFLLSESTTATRGAFSIFARSRSGGAAVNGDTIGVFRADIHDGTQFITGAQFTYSVDNAVSTGIVPTSLNIRLMDSVGTTASRMFIRYDGRIGMGTTVPNAVLDVRGDAIFNEAGGDFDFRIEGDTINDIFFVDASADTAGIRTQNPVSAFEVNGSEGDRVTTLNAATLTLDVTHNIVNVIYTGTGAVTITLPSATSSWNSTDGVGRTYIIKDGGANAAVNNITINRAGSDTIITDITGDTSVVINGNGDAVQLTAASSTTWILH